jgi:hypothetical protein
LAGIGTSNGRRVGLLFGCSGHVRRVGGVAILGKVDGKKSHRFRGLRASANTSATVFTISMAHGTQPPDAIQNRSFFRYEKGSEPYQPRDSDRRAPLPSPDSDQSRGRGHCAYGAGD